MGVVANWWSFHVPSPLALEGRGLGEGFFCCGSPLTLTLSPQSRGEGTGKTPCNFDHQSATAPLHDEHGRSGTLFAELFGWLHLAVGGVCISSVLPRLLDARFLSEQVDFRDARSSA